jgi:RNA polymerase sigma factor (sigma-70 family)
LKSGSAVLTIVRVFHPLPHSADFHIAEQCLEGNRDALERLSEKYRQPVLSFLMGAGATPDEARETVESLWADCVAPKGDRPAKLRHYNGNCALQTWLNRVAVNQWLNYKRYQQRWNALVPERIATDRGEENELPSEWSKVSSSELPAEAPLLEMMRDALQTAFTHCPPEDFVLLQLAHADGLKVVELARMFNCGIASISRKLKKAGERISDATLAHIRQTDPWLEIKWDDFVELSREASPACFGLE